MATIEELKTAILWLEQEAHICEEAADHHSKDGELSMAFERDAQYFRIAAACMWDKLERLESGVQARGGKQ